MSGRLDSNQRPPEPHSGGSGRKHRKNKPFHGLQFPHFPHFTPRAPQNPQIPGIPGSFLQFPAITGELAIYKERYLAERFGTPDTGAQTQLGVSDRRAQGMRSGW